MGAGGRGGAGGEGGGEGTGVADFIVTVNEVVAIVAVPNFPCIVS